MRKFLFILLAGGTAFAVWAQTNAVVEQPANKKPAEQEVGVTAASFVYSQDKNQAVYSGQVVVTNVQGTLACERLTIDLPPGGSTNTQPTNMVAETNVVIDFIRDNDTNHVTCDKAVYAYSVVNQVTNDTITFTGSTNNPAKVRNSKFWMTGEPLVWDNKTGQFSGSNTETVLIIPASAGGSNNANPFNFGK
jgi:lipopolysaccharide export system protein LptA